MNEITPELIARIATRLYNEIPVANAIPKSESEASSATSTIPTFPTTLELPGGEQWPNRMPALPATLSDARPAVEHGPLTALASTATPDQSADGLRTFVRRIRATHVRPGECAWRVTPVKMISGGCLPEVSCPLQVHARSTLRAFAGSFPLSNNRCTANHWLGWTMPPRRRNRRV